MPTRCRHGLGVGTLGLPAHFSERIVVASYRCIVADPPWQQVMTGRYKAAKNQRPDKLPYPTMTVEEVAALPIAGLAAEACHLWLWTTNAFLESGFRVMRSWGFNYLAPVHWIKPSGTGNYFVHRTQTVLFGYKGKCRFPLKRYAANVLFSAPGKHSEKPEETWQLIESVSPGPRLELFSRHRRPGWDVWGNEVENSITLG